MDYQQIINSNIKQLRLSKNLTQEEFAEVIGVSVQGISNIERNRYQPNSETVNKICRAFKISPAELLITEGKTNQEIIDNINILLKKCSKYKLKQLYEIIKIVTKNV